ncbi:MAG: hypothetical protein J1E96_04970 [Ruminococcus sp.]|nr:hypothetical protein [Ruminococcus sp.]
MKLKKLLKPEKSKILFPVLIILTVIAVIIVSVSAKYLRHTNEVKNIFSPAVSVIPQIQETFETLDRKVKKDVKIGVGETQYPVYVRTKLVFNWQEEGNENGAFYFEPPKDSDYELITDNTKWLNKDGYYYYTEPVPSNGVTGVLIKECKLKSGVTPPDGYALSVAIITQTVQAVGHTDEKVAAGGNDVPVITAVEDAWGVDLSQ